MSLFETATQENSHRTHVSRLSSDVGIVQNGEEIKTQSLVATHGIKIPHQSAHSSLDKFNLYQLLSPAGLLPRPKLKQGSPLRARRLSNILHELMFAFSVDPPPNSGNSPVD
jgi:hypothetical protein